MLRELGRRTRRIGFHDWSSSMTYYLENWIRLVLTLVLLLRFNTSPDLITLSNSKLPF